MTLKPEEVRHVAQLARLSLSPEEEQQFGAQLSRILDAVAQLNEVDTSRVEATSHATLNPAPLREDLVTPSLPPERALANAPAKVESAFAVPRIIE